MFGDYLEIKSRKWKVESGKQQMSCPALSLQKRKKKLSKGEEKWQIEIG